MPQLIVDDTPITDDKGDVFELDDDFEAPGGTRYVSDIHNPKGKPQRRVPQTQRAAFPGGGGRSAVGPPPPPPSGRQTPPSVDYPDDDKGPRLLTDNPSTVSGYHYQGPRAGGYRPVAMPQAPYWSQQAQQGPITGSFGQMPHPHQLSIQRQLESVGYRGFGGGHDAPAPYRPAPTPFYSGTVNYAMPAAPSYGGYGYGAPGPVAAPMYGPGYGRGGGGNWEHGY